MKLENSIIYLKDLLENDIRIDDIDNLSLTTKKHIAIVLQTLEKQDNKIRKCFEVIRELKAGQYTEGSKGYMFSTCCNNRLNVIEKILLEE